MPTSILHAQASWEFFLFVLLAINTYRWGPMPISQTQTSNCGRQGFAVGRGLGSRGSAFKMIPSIKILTLAMKPSPTWHSIIYQSLFLCSLCFYLHLSRGATFLMTCSNFTYKKNFFCQQLGSELKHFINIFYSSTLNNINLHWREVSTFSSPPPPPQVKPFNQFWFQDRFPPPSPRPTCPSKSWDRFSEREIWGACNLPHHQFA